MTGVRSSEHLTRGILRFAQNDTPRPCLIGHEPVILSEAKNPSSLTVIDELRYTRAILSRTNSCERLWSK